MQKLVIETTDANLLKPIIEGIIQRETKMVVLLEEKKTLFEEAKVD